MRQTTLALLILSISLTCLALPACQEKNISKPPSDSTVSMITDYTESHRPQFHFSPQEKWMNDPNGMLFYKGEYHLFYQYYPDSTVWGPMHWGHAVSPDMVHWEHLPIALYPDSLGYIFSGSAVVDHNNTTGFKKGEEAPLVAIFTYHDPIAEKAETHTHQTQGIAFSNDRGRTWIKYEGNPVIPNPGIHDFRDPKVIWDDDSQQWIMALAAYDQTQFWGSPDLKNWKHLSDFGLEWGAHGGVWECPDFFPMVTSETGEKKWVLIQSLNPGGANGGSGTQYFVGDFDGKVFTLEESFAKDVANQQALWIDYGRDNYAGVTWSDIPKSDGRRLFLGWMSNWNYATVVPTEKWRSATTIPRELVLRKTAMGYRIFSTPVQELTNIRSHSTSLQPGTLAKGMNLDSLFAGMPIQAELVVELEVTQADTGKIEIVLSNSMGESYRVGYQLGSNQFFSDRRNAGPSDFSGKFASKVHLAPRQSTSSTLSLHLFFDRSSAELFADNGACVMTDIFFPTDDFDRLRLSSTDTEINLISGTLYRLNRIWDQKAHLESGN